MNIVTYLITVHSDYVAALLPLESGRAWALGPVAYIQNSSESIQPTTADRQAPFNYDGFMTTTWCGLNSKFLSKPTALHQLHRTSRRPTSLPARASSALVLPKQRVAPRSCSSTEVANPRPSRSRVCHSRLQLAQLQWQACGVDLFLHSLLCKSSRRRRGARTPCPEHHAGRRKPLCDTLVHSLLWGTLFGTLAEHS